MLTFLSAPIRAGMRFGSENVVPYFYVELEPALLTSAYQSSSTTCVTCGHTKGVAGLNSPTKPSPKKVVVTPKQEFGFSARMTA